MRLDDNIDKFGELALLLIQPEDYLDKMGYKKENLNREFGDVCRKIMSNIADNDTNSILVNVIRQQCRSNNCGSDVRALIDIATYIQPTTYAENVLQDVMYGILHTIYDLRKKDSIDSSERKESIRRTLTYLLNYIDGDLTVSDGDMNELKKFLNE